MSRSILLLLLASLVSCGDDADDATSSSAGADPASTSTQGVGGTESSSSSSSGGGSDAASTGGADPGTGGLGAGGSGQGGTNSGGGGAAPSEWTCAQDAFADGAVCDCQCGAVDPDCLAIGLPVVGCFEEGDRCLADACTPVPDDWTCPERHFASFDGCDCGCGAVDPDCADPSAMVYGCLDEDGVDLGLACLPSGTCDVPEEWSCDPGDFDDGARCDCGCDVGDLDCAIDADLPVSGCADDQRCLRGDCTDIPLGDTCDTAILLAEGVYESSWEVAVNDYGAGCGFSATSAIGRDVAFRVELAAGQTLTVLLAPSVVDHVMFLVRSCDDVGATCVAAVDDAVNNQAETLSYTATQSEELYLIVDQYGSTTGVPFSMTVSIDP